MTSVENCDLLTCLGRPDMNCSILRACIMGEILCSSVRTSKFCKIHCSRTITKIQRIKINYRATYSGVPDMMYLESGVKHASKAR